MCQGGQPGSAFNIGQNCYTLVTQVKENTTYPGGIHHV